MSIIGAIEYARLSLEHAREHFLVNSASSSGSITCSLLRVLDGHSGIPIDNIIFYSIARYAVIKKDPPPRPPAPQPRRSKSTRSHERPFKTMPHLKTDEPKPERPARNYSTIIPDRPPRKNVTEVEK